MNEPLAISGIPLVVIVFGLVEVLKFAGLKGKFLTIFSLCFGIGLYLLFTAAYAGLPTSLAGWLEVAVVGLMFGLTASGIYNFIDKRFPKV